MGAGNTIEPGRRGRGGGRWLFWPFILQRQGAQRDERGWRAPLQTDGWTDGPHSAPPALTQGCVLPSRCDSRYLCTPCRAEMGSATGAHVSLSGSRGPRKRWRRAEDERRKQVGGAPALRPEGLGGLLRAILPPHVGSVEGGLSSEPGSCCPDDALSALTAWEPYQQTARRVGPIQPCPRGRQGVGPAPGT